MKKRILAALSALMVGGVLFSGCGMHRPHAMMGEDFNPRQMHAVMKKLDLSDEQKEAFQELRKEKMIFKRDFSKMSEHVTATSFDKEALIAYMASTSDESIRSKVDFMEKAYNILSPEQRQIVLDEFKEKSKEES